MPRRKTAKSNSMMSMLNTDKDKHSDQLDNMDSLSVESRVKNYSLNIQRALEKKLGSCTRPHIYVDPHDKVNSSLLFSTAAFEVARQALKNTFQFTESDIPKKIEFIADKDSSVSSNTVNEVIKVHDWSVVLLPYGVDYEGPCVITIHIYRTKSSMLVNGRDKSKYLDLYLPSLERHLAQNADQIDTDDATMRSMIKNSINNIASKPQLKRPTAKTMKHNMNEINESEQTEY